MKQTEDEKSLLALFREMESRAIREDLLAQAGAMVRAQRALKADYGLAQEQPVQAEAPAQAGKTA